MKTNFKILKAEKSDLKEILQLQYIAYQSEARLVNDFLIPPLTQTYEEKIAEFEKGVILKAAGQNGEIIGSVSAYFENGGVFIGKLIVKPELQGQGIGSKLLLEIEKFFAEKAQRYELFTGSKSVKNIEFYERRGYVKLKEQRQSDKRTLVYLEKIFSKSIDLSGQLCYNYIDLHSQYKE